MKLLLYLSLTTFFWGIAAIFDKLALGKGPAFAGMIVRQLVLGSAIILVALGAGKMGDLLRLDGRSALFFGLSGICGGALGLWTYYQALRMAGASLVVPITATYPLVAVLLSWIILGESLTPIRIVGTVLIILGVWLVK